MRRYVGIIFSLCLFFLYNSVTTYAHNNGKVKIAVISDPHIQDTCFVRSMNSQVHSTRLLNENYFAFLAALNDVARKGIKNVMISGDMTDNGQKMNIQLTRKILDNYCNKYGIHFYLMCGNHDPSTPIADNSKDGKMKLWGYKEITNELYDYDFMPEKNYIYWATPFSSYDYSSYSYADAVKESDISKRVYEYNNLKPSIPDVSYLVEPIKGVWLLAIDASVYNPKVVKNDSIYLFEGAKTGYQDILRVKSYLLPWIKKVASEAKKYNKRLIAFSHFPMADFNDGASSEIEYISMPGKFDVQRVPDINVTKQLADAGISLHFGGHMHMNDEAKYKSGSGNVLRNIQVSSLAGYIPSYKILTLDNNRIKSIETIIVDDVPGFKSFFKRYEAEYDSLKQVGYSQLWDKSILQSDNYKQFCERHLSDLVRLRYIPTDFIPLVKNKFISMSSNEIFDSVGIKTNKGSNWNGLDMITDFYKYRFGGKMAGNDIPKDRIRDYKRIIKKIDAGFIPKNELEEFILHFSRVLKMQMEDTQ